MNFGMLNNVSSKRKLANF